MSELLFTNRDASGLLRLYVYCSLRSLLGLALWSSRKIAGWMAAKRKIIFTDSPVWAVARGGGGGEEVLCQGVSERARQ